MGPKIYKPLQAILWSFDPTGPHGEWGIENLKFSILDSLNEARVLLKSQDCEW